MCSLSWKTVEKTEKRGWGRGECRDKRGPVTIGVQSVFIPSPRKAEREEANKRQQWWVQEGRRPESGTSYTAGAHKISSGEGPGRLDGEKGNSGGDSGG